MITSTEISQIMASQTNMFMGQDAYAQQIGIASPAAMGGPFPQQYGTSLPVSEGAGNMGPMPGRTYDPRMPMYLRPEAPFRRTGVGMFGPGPQAGNQFAGTVFSAGSGLATAGGIGLGMMGLSPLSAATAAYGAVGGGLLGGMAGLAAGGALAVPMAMAGAGVDAYIRGGVNQGRVSSALANNFQFYNPMARGGEGFTREDTARIGQSMKQLEYIPEMMTSVEEMTQKILPKLKAMGVMQGVRDAEEFNKRFKEAVTAINDVSRILGTTMEEATKFFEHSRSMGFISRKSQLSNLMNMKYMAGEIGSTMEEKGAMQQGAAATARGYGARGRLGATAVMENIGGLQGAQSQGLLREGFLEDYTGMSGAAGMRAAAERITSTMASGAMAKSAMGNAMMLGMMKIDENGRPVLREDLADKFKRGEVTRDYLQAQFDKMTKGDKMAFVAHPEDLAAQFSKLGPRGIYGFAEAVSKTKDPNEVNLILRKQFPMLGDRDIEALTAIGRSRDTDAIDKKDFVKRQMQEMRIRERTDVAGQMKKAFKGFYNRNFGGLEESAMNTFSNIGAAYEDKVDQLLGRGSISVTEETANLVGEAMSGSSSAIEKLTPKTSRPAITLNELYAKGDFSNTGSWLGSSGKTGTGKTQIGDIASELVNLGVMGPGISFDEAFSKGKEKAERLKKIGRLPATDKLKGLMTDVTKSLGSEWESQSAKGKLDLLLGARGPEVDRFWKASREIDETKNLTMGELAMAFAGEEAGFDFDKLAKEGIEQEEVMRSSDEIAKAKRELSSGAKATYGLMVAGKGDILKAATRDERTRQKVQEILGGESKEVGEKEAAQLKALLGRSVDVKDLGGLRASMEDFRKDKTLGEKIGVFEEEQKQAAITLERLSSQNLASGLTGTGGAEGLKKALETFGDTSTDYKTGFMSVREQVKKYAGDLMSATGEQEKALIKGGGIIGDEAASYKDLAKRLSSTSKAKDIAAAFKLPEDRVREILGGKDTIGSGAAADRIRKELVQAATGNVVGKRLVQSTLAPGAGDVKGEAKLEQTLADLNVTLGEVRDELHGKNAGGLNVSLKWAMGKRE